DDVGPFVGEGGPVRGARRQRVGVALSGVLPVRRALARVSCGGFHPLPRPTRRRPPRCSERVGEYDGSCPDRAPAGGAKTGQVRRTGFSCYGNATFVARIFRSEEHTSELQSRFDLVCRLLLEKKK